MPIVAISIMALATLISTKGTKYLAPFAKVGVIVMLTLVAF
jgi:amino acid transporter